MEEQLCYDVLRIIFKNLPQEDLYNASLVSRYWEDVAKDENYTRGPARLELTCNNVIAISSDSVKQFLETRLSKMSNFQMFFIFQEIIQEFMDDCQCKYLQPHCYSLTLRIFWPLDFKAFITNMSLPDSYKIEISTYTFLKRPGPMSIYCPELRFVTDPNFELVSSMKIDFERYFDDNNPMKSSMILFCDLNNIWLLKRVLASLEKWFPDNKISIWGGVTREILICKNFYSMHHCMAPASCVFIFISNKNLKTWSITWPAEYETKEIVEMRFERLKLNIKFKNYSFGFIYIAGCRCPGLFYLECDLFEKFFPKVPYVYLFGPAALEGEDFKTVSRKNSTLKNLFEGGPEVMGHTETSIMILTYD